MTDLWLVDALTEIRHIAALPDSDAYPALQAYLDRWQLQAEDGPTMGDLLGDPDWERRELRKDMIRLRAALQHEIIGGRKILTWHAQHLAAEADRLARDYSTAALDVEPELTGLTLEARARAQELEARIAALPQRRAGARGRTR